MWLLLLFTMPSPDSGHQYIIGQINFNQIMPLFGTHTGSCKFTKSFGLCNLSNHLKLKDFLKTKNLFDFACWENRQHRLVTI